jgi:hypothetical protein
VQGAESGRANSRTARIAILCSKIAVDLIAFDGTGYVYCSYTFPDIVRRMRRTLGLPFLDMFHAASS